MNYLENGATFCLTSACFSFKIKAAEVAEVVFAEVAEVAVENPLKSIAEVRSFSDYLKIGVADFRNTHLKIIAEVLNKWLDLNRTNQSSRNRQLQARLIGQKRMAPT